MERSLAGATFYFCFAKTIPTKVLSTPRVPLWDFFLQNVLWVLFFLFFLLLFFLLLFFLFFCFLFRFSFFLSFFVFVLPWVLVLWFQKKCLQNFFRHRELLDRNCSTFFINFVAWKPIGLLSTLRKAWWAHLPKNFFFLLSLSHLLHLHQILLHIYFIVKNYVVFIIIVVFFVLTVLKTNN